MRKVLAIFTTQIKILGMRTLSYLWALVLTLSFVQAQDFNPSWLKNTPARNIGPAGMSGRITAIDVVHQQPEIMYVGTASGGVWKSTSGGIKWTPLFEDKATASVGAIAIQQSNPDVVWVGTGEGNPRNSLNGGYGIYRSLDGGKTWQLMGLEKTRHIHRIIIHPKDPNTVYAAAIGSPWGTHPERGVYKTTDGGKTWDKILYANPSTGAADLVMDPSNPNKLIAALWEHKRDPWFFNSGGAGSGLYITVDGGATWTKKTEKDGLPKGPLGRIGLAISRSNPNKIYALVEAKKNALYRSDDGGTKWRKINDKNEIGNRPFYYSDIFVDPENENRVYSVFTYVNVSEDGGKSFKELMPAYGVSNGVHPDHHAWWIHPENGKFMIEGNDGGLNITHDRGASWRFVENIPVGQFYHVSVDNEYPYNVYGGMQDNGSWRGPAYVWKAQGIRNAYWQEIAFGDGFDVVPDKDDSRYGFAMSQQGYVVRYDWKTGNNYSVRPTHPNPEVQLRFNWNAAIAQDPFDNSTLYFGSQFVHKSTDKGLTWTVISSDLTTNDPEKQKQSESGGLTMDATGAENHCTLLVIEPDPLQQGVLWTASDDGRVHITMDNGQQWTDVSSGLKGLPKGSWITQIKASNKNKGEALLVANDYRRYNYTPYVYRTTNYGKKWERIVTADDVASYALSIVEDIENPNLLFLGTDDGLYVSLDKGGTWTKMDSKVFPTVSTKDLVIHPREHDLVIGTFGRSIWVLDDIRPLRALAKNPAIKEKAVHLFEPPTAYMAAYQQANGTRFGGDAIYNGTNKRSGAMLSFFAQPKSSSSSDTLKLKIYDGDRLIRTLTRKMPKEEGIHRWYWRLREKGNPSPSRKKNSSKVEPSGVRVLPGNYTVELSYGDVSNKQTLVVKADPRIPTKQEDLEAVYTAAKTLEAMEASATAITKQLVSCKEITTHYKKLMEKDKEKYKALLKSTNEILKGIEGEFDRYLGKVDKRQGITRNREQSVMTRIYTAYSYVSSRKQGLTSTETKLMEHAKTAVEAAVKASNTFIQSTWLPFQEELKAAEITPFKTFEPVTINTTTK